MKKLAFLTICALSLGPVTALAQDHANHSAQAPKPKLSKVDEALTKLDTDKDGFVTKTEIPDGHALLDHFDMADKNKDGKLNRSELGIALKML